MVGQELISPRQSHLYHALIPKRILKPKFWLTAAGPGTTEPLRLASRTAAPLAARENEPKPGPTFFRCLSADLGSDYLNGVQRHPLFDPSRDRA